MDIPDIGTYLRQYRKNRKKTLQHVADAIGASSSYVSQIEKGIRNPSDEALESVLTKAFDLEKSEAEMLIRSWRIRQYGGEKIPNIKKLKTLEKGHEAKLPEGAAWVDELPLLPFYKTINENFEVTKPDSYWPFFVENPKMLKRLFIWQMNDSSMDPKIPKSAILIIDRDIEELPYRSTVLTLVGNKAAIRYYEKHDDRVKLIPANHQYPVYFGQAVPVFGKVVQMLVNI